MVDELAQGATTDQTLQRIYDMLTNAYQYLFHFGNKTGDWRDVRSAALVALCLRLREPVGSPWLVGSKRWLLDQHSPIEDGMGTWGEEIWDSSFAILALKQLGLSEKDVHIRNTADWILSLFNKNGRNNWHDEPWETSWAIIALSELSTYSKVSSQLVSATDWLLSLQDSNGRIISPHYTAFFLMVNQRVQKLTIPQEKIQKYDKGAELATQYLIGMISSNALWTGEAWSNGQVLWALCSTNRFPLDNAGLVSEVIDWFHKSQEDNGRWSDIEDTASSILGLGYLARGLEQRATRQAKHGDLVTFDILRSKLQTPVFHARHEIFETNDDGSISLHLGHNTRRNLTMAGGLLAAAAAIYVFWPLIVEIVLWIANRF